MPFTFAHPAVILPFNYLNKKYISITGLVIGSLTPDFEYFFRMRDISRYSHTWLGLFWFDLPLGLLLCFMFHNIVRVPLIKNAPEFLARRIATYKAFNWNQCFRKNYWVVLCCILVGAASHLLLDSFAHGTVPLLQSIPWLKENFGLVRQPLKLYFAVTSCYSFMGVAAGCYAIWQLPHDKKVKPHKHIPAFWLIIFVVALLVYNVVLLSRGSSTFHFEDYFGSAISSFLLALFSTSIFQQMKWKFTLKSRAY